MESYFQTIESKLTASLFGNCSALDHKALRRVLKTTQWITGTRLLTIKKIYSCLGRAISIIKDTSNSNHVRFTLFPSGRGYWSLGCCTSRLTMSFFLLPSRTPNHSAEHHRTHYCSFSHRLNLSHCSDHYYTSKQLHRLVSVLYIQPLNTPPLQLGPLHLYVQHI